MCKLHGCTVALHGRRHARDGGATSPRGTALARAPEVVRPPWVHAALLLALAGASAAAEPHHCAARVSLDETLVGQVEPVGVENQLTLSWCWPLVDREGPLFDETRVQVGLYDFASPIYVQQGAFVSVTPLSPLVLRADAAVVQYWPLPLDGAGYFAVDGYGAPYRDAALPAARAGAASGVEAGGSATVQGEVALSPSVALAASDTFAPEYWAVGGGAFWVNERRDAILARTDWLVKQTGVVVVEAKGARETASIGVTDDLTWVPRARYVGNIVGGIAMLDLRRADRPLHELSAFVRVGGYTQHAFRRGANALFGVSAVWDWPHR